MGNFSNPSCDGRDLAERGGFEPPIRFNPYNGLANRRFRPLSHLSIKLITRASRPQSALGSPGFAPLAATRFAASKRTTSQPIGKHPKHRPPQWPELYKRMPRGGQVGCVVDRDFVNARRARESFAPTSEARLCVERARVASKNQRGTAALPDEAVTPNASRTSALRKPAGVALFAAPEHTRSFGQLLPWTLGGAGLRAGFKSRWHRLRRQLAAAAPGGLVARRHRPVACATPNQVLKTRSYVGLYLSVPMP